MNSISLKNLLDALYFRYSEKYSSKDPVWNLHKFSDEKDIEIIGLITSCYAYGQVDLINKFMGILLNRIGNKPHEFTINFSKRKDKKYLSGLGYRFHKDYDLNNVFLTIQHVLKVHGSLQNLFKKGYCEEHKNIIPALSFFVNQLVSNISENNKLKKKYFNYLLPDPTNGSTCKRLMLYLRWMVRKDEIDFGIWKGIPSSKLVMPVDIHVSRVAKRLKLVKRKSIDLKFALELTENLKRFDPDDPVKYDFSLCHYQMEGKNIL
jgi:uncharacterized protein (TIGR02757 family)